MSGGVAASRRAASIASEFLICSRFTLKLTPVPCAALARQRVLLTTAMNFLLLADALADVGVELSAEAEAQASEADAVGTDDVAPAPALDSSTKNAAAPAPTATDVTKGNEIANDNEER